MKLGLIFPGGWGDLRERLLFRGKWFRRVGPVPQYFRTANREGVKPYGREF